MSDLPHTDTSTSGSVGARPGLVDQALAMRLAMGPGLSVPIGLAGAALAGGLALGGAPLLISALLGVALFFAFAASDRLFYIEARLRNAASATSDAQTEPSLLPESAELVHRLLDTVRPSMALVLSGLRDEAPADPDAAEAWRAAAVRGAAHVLLAIDELDAILRIGSGAISIAPRPVDLAALARQAADTFTSAARETRLRVQLVGADEPALALVDPHLALRALYCLTANAVRAAPKADGVVTIAVSSGPSAVHLAVSDNGPGVQADQREAIFRPFVKGDPSSTGLGVGLPLARAVARAHRGTLALTAHEGEGATFTLTFPRQLDPANPRPAPAPPLADATAALHDFLFRAAHPPGAALPLWGDDEPELVTLNPEAPFVMIVEQNPDLRAWLRAALRDRYGVASVADGETALRRARTLRPHLIVVGAQAQVGGEPFLAAVRRDPAICTTPMLCLTAAAGTRSDEEADARGADDALALPFDRGLLVARVGNLLRCREQSRTIEKLRRRLEARIEDQLGELVRRGQLRQHLPQALLDGALHQVDDSDAERFERRWVTVLYVGLTGLSDVADRVDPHDLSVMVNTAARELTAEAVAHGGVVDQFFGDTLLVMFGAVEASKPEEQGVSAVRAAFAIRDRARSMAAHWHRYGLPRELDVRVGIDTGLGAVGVIGSELTRRFTVLGPVSHTAAYLHTLPSESGVLASLAAFAKFRRVVKAKLRGTQPVAALHRNLEIYEIQALADDD